MPSIADTRQRVITRGRVVWPARLHGSPAGTTQPSPCQKVRSGRWPSGCQPPSTADGWWSATRAGSPGERGLAAAIKAERDRQMEMERGRQGEGARSILDRGVEEARGRAWPRVPPRGSDDVSARSSKLVLTHPGD